MKTTATLAGSALAAIGATACCTGPLVLVLLGFSGATAARLESLAAYQPLFVLLTVGLMAIAFYQLFVVPRRCAPSAQCESTAAPRRQRAMFWIVATFIGTLALFPLFSEYLY